ncbi:patatin-like phospholipase family protein [Burkholderia gladioli]|uniref:patatin-like phospholipase family protein n=1 Tax=Burkholderia gladioli TaxID=28095 RepID=UPI0016404473|nr:patatin-like phospholipase family protein [Burkholderia gladioli]
MNEQQSVNSSASTSPSNPPVFLVFQGGGARGIAHVGGLAAVNELDLDIAGVAGTSAGAIMAALVAARYRADQLLNPENGTHLLQTVADGQFRIATSLFSEEGWQRIRRLRDYGAIAGKVWKWVTCRWQTYSGKLAAGLIGLGLGWIAFIQAPAVALETVSKRRVATVNFSLDLLT